MVSSSVIYAVSILLIQSLLKLLIEIGHHTNTVLQYFQVYLMHLKRQLDKLHVALLRY